MTLHFSLYRLIPERRQKYEKLHNVHKRALLSFIDDVAEIDARICHSIEADSTRLEASAEGILHARLKAANEP